jgi:MFS family permease
LMPDSPSLTEPPAHSGTFAAFSNPDYRKFYLGQGISLIGTWLQAAAVSWIVFDRTKSERMSGLVEAAGIVPGLFVGVLAGVLADRVFPRTMILLSQFAQMALACLLAILVASGRERVWQLALIVALTRIFVTFEMPARQVFLYDVVGRGMLVNAIALNSGLFNASRVIGPALAGLCLARLGEAACFGLNGASYLGAIASLLLIRVRPRPRHSSGKGMREIFGGFHYLIRDHRVRSLFLLMTGFGLLGGGFNALGPSYAQRLIGTGTGGYSLLLAMGGLGATLGALLVASLGGVERRDRLVLVGIVIFSISMAAAVVIPPQLGPFGGVARLVSGSLCLMGTGLGAIVFYAATQTMIQSAVPDTLRGRVMGIWMIVYSGSVPLGCLWAGELAQWSGVGPVMILSACLCVTLTFLAAASGAIREREEL